MGRARRAGAAEKSGIDPIFSASPWSGPTLLGLSPGKAAVATRPGRGGGGVWFRFRFSREIPVWMRGGAWVGEDAADILVRRAEGCGMAHS